MKRLLRYIFISISFLLCTLFLGCSWFGISCSGCVPNGSEELKESISDIVKDSIDGITDFSATETPAKQPLSLADEMFLGLDSELFVWYVTQDILTLDQCCRMPEKFGINEQSVPVTLGEFTEEANDVWLADCRHWLERLRKIDRASLNEQNAFAYDVYCRYFELELLYDGLFYCYEPLDEYVGLQVNLPLTFGLYRFYEEQDIENYLTLLADVPRYYDQVLAFEQKRAELGLFMTEEMLDLILADFASVVDSRDNSFLYATFRAALEELDFLTEEQREAYYARNDALLKTSWADSHQKMYDGLSSLRPYCRESVGAKDLGADALRYYEAALCSESASPFTVEEAVAFLEGCLDEYIHSLNFHYQMTDETELDVTSGTIEGDVRYLRTLMREIVPTMPDVTVSYVDFPPELEDAASPAAYLIPTLDGYTDNIILINPKYGSDLMTLAHEGYPGHMYQFVYQYGLEELPMFQKVITTNGYAEGWSTNMELHVSELADAYDANYCQMIFYDDMATNTIVTLCSLQVNGYGMDERALAVYLEEWNLQEFSSEIYDMAVNMPIYYFKYVLGFAQHRDILNRCEELAQFDSVSYYQEYLKWGPCYFDQIEEKMLDWGKNVA